MQPKFFLAAVAMLLAAVPSRAGDGLVALQTADPSCPDDSGKIYVDCGNGTVTDNRTGLVWLKNADCLDGGEDWFRAMEFVAGLADMPAGSGASATDCGLSDSSSPGEWRLPSAAEWEAMIADANGGPGELDCDPTITDNQGTGCWAVPIACAFQGRVCSFTDVQSSFYWSSTTNATPTSFGPAFAWFVNLSQGWVGNDLKGSSNSVWPVRGGQ